MVLFALNNWPAEDWRCFSAILTWPGPFCAYYLLIKHYKQISSLCRKNLCINYIGMSLLCTSIIPPLVIILTNLWEFTDGTYMLLLRAPIRSYYRMSRLVYTLNYNSTVDSICLGLVIKNIFNYYKIFWSWKVVRLLPTCCTYSNAFDQ